MFPESYLFRDLTCWETRAIKFRTLKKKRQLTLKCTCGRATEPTLSPYFIPVLCRAQSRGSKDSGSPRIPHPLWDLDRSHEGPWLELQPQCWVGSPGVNHLALQSRPPRVLERPGGSTAGAWEEQMQIKMETYTGLRRPACPGHPPETACALPPAWDGGATGKSQLHRAVAGRSRQESVGDAPMEDRLVGDRTARLGTAGPACFTATTVAPAAPRPAAKVPAAVAASQEAARVLPASNHGPLRFMSFVISRTWQGVLLEKYSRKASCVNELVRGLFCGLIVWVSFSFQRGKRSMINFGYSHFRYLK